MRELIALNRFVYATSSKDMAGNNKAGVVSVISMVYFALM